MHTFKRKDRGDITARYDKLALAKRMSHVPLQKMAKLVVCVYVHHGGGMMIDKSISTFWLCCLFSWYNVSIHHLYVCLMFAHTE